MERFDAREENDQPHKVPSERHTNSMAVHTTLSTVVYSHVMSQAKFDSEENMLQQGLQDSERYKMCCGT